MKVRRCYTPFQDCSFPLAACGSCVCPAKQWETSNLMIRKPCFSPQSSFQPITFIFSNFLVVLMQAQTLWFPKLRRGELQLILLLSDPRCPPLGEVLVESPLHPPLLQQVSSIEEAGLAGSSLKGFRSFFSGAQNHHEANVLSVSSSEGWTVTEKGNGLSHLSG